jgi:PTS system N-acetylglucosamine-specific IIB component
VKDQAATMLAALGGVTITRLRVEVIDPSLVNEAALKATGAFGVVRSGKVVQVVVGTEADTLASDIEDLR